MTLPDALVIGPMKAGTTWIQDYLAARGDVALPAGVKETFFFDRRYDKGLDWYGAHFHGVDPARHRRIIEVAPSYFHCPAAPERVRSSLGEIRMVVTLRDPVQRAWSHYLHLRRYGYTKAPLSRAAEAFPEILEASRYKTCLARWRACFVAGDIHILWQDVLKGSSGDYVESLCKALDVGFIPSPDTLSGPRNAAAIPRFYRLAAIGDRTAHLLRERRLYSVVNFAKRIGLKGLFFGRAGGATMPALEESDASWLKTQLAHEMPDEYLRRALG